MAWYVDTSALGKLARSEAETAALEEWLVDRDVVGSDLHRTELRRVARRAGGVAPQRAEHQLAELELLSITPDVFDRAGTLGPAGLRSLDALHLAAAMSLGPDLEGVVTYDARMAAAAASVGVVTVSPGA